MLESLTRALLDPVSIVLVILAAALFAEGLGRHRLARGIVIFTTLLLASTVILPMDAIVARPLENQYARPALPEKVDGILVLSGGVRAYVYISRHAMGENSTLPRMTEAVALARHFPQAKLVFSGASGTDDDKSYIEKKIVEEFFVSQGIAPGRTIYETHSHNTWENIADSRALVHPKAGETWILVTSALHMPRAIGVANRQGWTMLPWPAGYNSTAHMAGVAREYPSRRFLVLAQALHEWLGYIAYALEGRLA